MFCSVFLSWVNLAEWEKKRIYILCGIYEIFISEVKIANGYSWRNSNQFETFPKLWIYHLHLDSKKNEVYVEYYFDEQSCAHIANRGINNNYCY